MSIYIYFEYLFLYCPKTTVNIYQNIGDRYVPLIILFFTKSIHIHCAVHTVSQPNVINHKPVLHCEFETNAVAYGNELT